MKDQILVIDFETGGLNPLTDGICSLSVSTFDKTKKKTWYFKPQPNLRYELHALNINGLSIELLNEKGLEYNQVLDELLNFIIQNYEKLSKYGYGIKVLGHNTAFDIGFLKALIGEERYKYFFHYHFKCSMIFAEGLKDAGFLSQIQSLKLLELHKYLFPEEKLYLQAHKSEIDVEMCIDVYNGLQKLLRD